MLFNSIQFLIFFPIVTALYFALPYRQRWGLLLVASCVFYAAFIPHYLLILFLSIVIDYLAGIWIEDAPPPRRKSLLVVSIIANVGLLFVFKYFNFANENLARLAEFLHWNYPISGLSLILPIGLSFHTFQAMSYTIEVYRGHQKAERHFGIYALYVLFYPQLVAGPIERPQNLLQQLRGRHAFDYERVTDGCCRMLWGMLKKVVIADRLAVAVNVVYASPEDHHGLAFLAATVFFAFQIYYDFSAYSDIALGAAQVMGIRLMENFRSPYGARSIADFWKRWHISLSTWFRDYVYIPLGGNRVSPFRRYMNLMIVFLLSGLWHGANWTFLVWGGLHGFYLIFAMLTQGIRARIHEATGLAHFPRVHALLQTLTVFSLVTFGWIFFRAESLADAFYVAGQILPGCAEFIQNAFAGRTYDAFGLNALYKNGADFALVLLSIVAVEMLTFVKGDLSLRQFAANWPTVWRWGMYETIVLAIIFLGEFGSRQFIYFQF